MYFAGNAVVAYFATQTKTAKDKRIEKGGDEKRIKKDVGGKGKADCAEPFLNYIYKYRN